MLYLYQIYNTIYVMCIHTHATYISLCIYNIHIPNPLHICFEMVLNFEMVPKNSITDI